MVSIVNKGTTRYGQYQSALFSSPEYLIHNSSVQQLPTASDTKPTMFRPDALAGICCSLNRNGLVKGPNNHFRPWRASFFIILWC